MLHVVLYICWLADALFCIHNVCWCDSQFLCWLRRCRKSLWGEHGYQQSLPIGRRQQTADKKPADAKPRDARQLREPICRVHACEFWDDASQDGGHWRAEKQHDQSTDKCLTAATAHNQARRQPSDAVMCPRPSWACIIPGSYRSGKTGKSQGIWLFRESHGESKLL